jgi:predicted nucleic acid-binding protein
LIFLDSSALVKRYVREDWSGLVLGLMIEDPDWVASELAWSETRIALCRRGPEGAPGSRSQDELMADWLRFMTVSVDAECLTEAAAIGCRFGVRSLDAVHLAAAVRLPSDVRFLSFDQHQVEAAFDLGLSVIVPSGDAG